MTFLADGLDQAAACSGSCSVGTLVPRESQKRSGHAGSRKSMSRLQRRLDEGPVQRAIFEFLIIVTGVLVALAVDEWRQERAEIRELNQHLVSLLEEVENNLESVTFIRVSLTQVKTPGLETVIAHLESGDETVDDPDEFLHALADSTLLANPWFTTSRFEALRFRSRSSSTPRCARARTGRSSQARDQRCSR